MDAALVRVREYYWLRMWKTLDRAAAGAEDLLAVEATFSCDAAVCGAKGARKRF